jgi:dienelactone hydrolase
MRTDITFRSGDDKCAGWLYRPEGFEGPRPLMVMAHGFSGTKEMRLPAYAERFCAAGIGVLLFDYRHFGASGGEPRQLLDISRQHADFRSALAYARDLDWVDPERVGLFGSSFSGGHVIAVGSADDRVAAIVAQCPFTDGFASLPVLGLGLKTLMRAGVAGLRDQLGALRGGAPHYIPAVGPPGGFAIMTKPDVVAGFNALIEQSDGVLWENRVAARIVLRMGMYRPGLKAGKLPCPALFAICDQDSVAPAGRTAELAARGQRNEILHYPIGHFDPYVGEAWERAVADQTEFLVRTLKP